MGWLWKSKSSKAKEVAAPPIEQTLQEEIDRLQELNAESSRLQAEWQASAEAAIQERDALRAEADDAIATEQQRSGEKIAELEASLTSTQEKLRLLDEANVSMAQMIRERDQKLEEVQTTSADDLQERDTAIQQRDQRLAELTAEVANLTQQLEKANDSATSKIEDLEQRLAKGNSEALERIKTLEQQLAESEARSASRAEQRSALLRNMMEIHRLSTTSSKSEASSESLKLINPGWSEAATNQSSPADDDSTNSSSLYARSGT